MERMFSLVLRGMLQKGPAGWIVCCFLISPELVPAAGWEGFQPAIRFAMEAPVVNFSPGKAVTSRLAGFGVGTNGVGVKVFQGFDGSLFQEQTVISSGFAQSIDMNYFNADTIPDIVVPSYFGASFTVYLGGSDGSFVRGETYQLEGHCTWVCTADFNEDGKTDIAAAHNGSGQPLHLYIYLGNGDGTFTRFQKYPTQFDTPTEVIVADVNNDTHMDIAYSLSGPAGGVLFPGNGDGTFKAPVLITAHDSNTANGSSEGFSLADINSDGNIDWIGGQEFLDSIIVRLGDGTGEFVPSTSLYLPHSFDIETADINGDGTIDIIASNLDSVVCFLQDHQGRFFPSATIHSGHGAVKLLATDLDHDGFPDIIVSNLDSAFSVAINKGSSPAGVDRTDAYPSDVALFQNYPNPFNPTTNIGFQVSDFGFVSLKIYDILGREVATLVNERKPAGKYSVTWNASSMASGVYFYRLEAGSFVETKKLLLLR